MAEKKRTEAKSSRKILAVVDGTEQTGRVLEFLLSLAADGLQLNVVVMNVQPAPQNWRLRGYGSFKEKEILDRLINDLGVPVVRSAARRLQGRHIPHKEVVEVGSFVDTVLRRQHDEGCDWIVTSERPARTPGLWLLKVLGVNASRSSQLIQLAGVPVTVLK